MDISTMPSALGHYISLPDMPLRLDLFTRHFNQSLNVDRHLSSQLHVFGAMETNNKYTAMQLARKLGNGFMIL